MFGLTKLLIYGLQIKPHRPCRKHYRVELPVRLEVYICFGLKYYRSYENMLVVYVCVLLLKAMYSVQIVT